MIECTRIYIFPQRCIEVLVSLLIILSASPLSAQTISTTNEALTTTSSTPFYQPFSTFSGSFSLGVVGQYGKIANNSFAIGPMVSVALAYRPSRQIGLSIVGSYDYYQTSLTSLNTSDEVRGGFVSLGTKFDFSEKRESVMPYLILGVGSGSFFRRINENVSDIQSPIREETVTSVVGYYGVGLTIHISQRSSLIPQLRFFVGDNTGVALPLTIGFQQEF